MGIAYPRRVRRSSFGPKLVNDYPVEKPQSEVGDIAFNGLFWAVAGHSQIAHRAGLVAVYTGGNFVISHQGEAWNPDGDQPRPVLARSAAGRYSYTFAASYVDEDGIDIAPDIRAARCAAQVDGSSTTVGEAYAWINPVNPLQVLIRTGTRVVSTGVLTDSDQAFWLEVL